MSDFENILEKAGGYGKYQRTLVYLIIIPTSFFIAFTINAIIFQSHVPDHWCHVPGRDSTLYSIDEWKNISIPKTNDGETYERCLRYNNVTIHDNEVFIQDNSTSECMHGWEYDSRFFTSTVATTNQWFCDLEDYSTHIMSFSYLGSAVGTIILPILADKYCGRRKMFFIAMSVYLVFLAPILWVNSPIWHLFFRFCVGLAFQTNYQMPYLIVLELIPPDKRAWISFLSFAAWTLSMCLTALITYLIPQWRILATFVAIPSIVSFAMWRVLPESPRWLLYKGRIEECADVLINIATTNGRILDKKKMINDLNEIQKEEPSEDNSKEILKYPLLIFRLFLLVTISVIVFVIYACVLFNIDILPDNYFLNYFILSFMEFPSNLLGLLEVHYLGRRATGIITFVATGLFSIVAVLTFENKYALLGAVSVLKIFSTQGIYVVYVSAGELLPTPIRSTGLGFMAVGGLIGISITPYIIHANLDPLFQYYVMFMVSIAGLICAFAIPETLSLPLPQTYEQAKHIGSNAPFFKWIHHWNVEAYLKAYTAVSTNE